MLEPQSEDEEIAKELRKLLYVNEHTSASGIQEDGAMLFDAGLSTKTELKHSITERVYLSTYTGVGGDKNRHHRAEKKLAAYVDRAKWVGCSSRARARGGPSAIQLAGLSRYMN